MTQSARSVLVIGGTGGVGSGIVDALLDDETFARVLVSSRDSGNLERLRDSATSPRLVLIEGSVDDRSAAEALLARSRSYGALTDVVASLGGWWEGGALTALDDEAWRAALASLLTPHFIAARTFVPALAAGDGRYLSIGGDAAMTPVPGATLVSIAGAAQLMLTRALVIERADRVHPIVEELIVSGSVATNAAHHGAITPGEITAREIGDVVANLLRDGTTGDWPHVTRDGPLVRMFPRRSAF